jgi:ABC-type Fe3+/spermidine/putrescine transport system ATPase subunit
MTVYDNIVFGLRIRGVPANQRIQRAKEILRVVKMEEYAARYPNQLSGGQQQRIALARALVVEPDVLLLDEPLSNLDAKLRLETRDEIKRIQKETKVTSIYVTHDQEEALSMADEVAIMRAGQIEQIGTPWDVYNRPSNIFVASFLGNTNIIRGKVGDEDANGMTTLEMECGESIHVSKERVKIVKGESISCAIRPEKITISDSANMLMGFNNSFKAKIQSLVYYGLVEQYSLLCTNGVEIKITNFNPSGHERKEGDIVFLMFKDEDVLIFPA